VLQAGERPPTPKQFSCGTTTSDSLRTGTLQNNVNYAVGVAGQDALGNSGAISPIECAAPFAVDDFFEICSREGCPGGGGFCSLSPGRRAPGAALGSTVVALLVLAGLCWRRARAHS
jgi:hypothetical protein